PHPRSLLFLSPPPPPPLSTLSLHDALPIFLRIRQCEWFQTFLIYFKIVHPFVDERLILPALVNDIFRHSGKPDKICAAFRRKKPAQILRSEEHTSELQSRFDLVCRLLLEKKKDIR